MVQKIKQIAKRSEDTLLEDAAGAAALMTLLVVALHLPALI